MKIIILCLCILSAATLCANPIYMKYDGVDGSVSAQVEVRNGKAMVKKLKPGSYRISLIFTGKDAKTADGKTRTNVLIGSFTNSATYKGGVRVAVGDVNGDGASSNVKTGATLAAPSTPPAPVTQAEYGLILGATGGQTAQGMGAGKVSVRDFSFMLQPNGSELVGQLGTVKLTPPGGNTSAEGFFDVSAEILFN
jgi:hypothetical protein